MKPDRAGTIKKCQMGDQCGEILIREEREFLDRGRDCFGATLCFKCFDAQVIETIAEEKTMEKSSGAKNDP